MTAWILGISAFYHDSAAALLKDGEVVAAAQEERFTRVKGDSGYPANAVAYCLGAGGISPADLQSVAFYEKPHRKFERLLETHLSVAPDGFGSLLRSLPRWGGLNLRLSDRIGEALGPGFRGSLHFVDHHAAHGASAFFPSPFQEAAVLTFDAVGEWATSSIGHGRDHRIRVLKEMRFPHSLGMLYSAFTHYTGFKVNSGEYKLMGLAPYGTPRYVDRILDHLVDVREDGSLWLDMDYFEYHRGRAMTSPRFHDLFQGEPRREEETITQKEMDLAASVQVVTERAVMAAAHHAARETGASDVVLAGGVALNCVANGKLLRQGPFRRLWVQPAAGDAGGALGAALLVWHHLQDRPRVPSPGDAQKGSFLGPSFTEEEIGLSLDAAGARYERIDDEAELLDRVAHLMADERVVGWFHGRMEYGPRALGARSIIGDARSPRMQQVMNLKIKFRESFRPFAPCVLREYASEYFELDPEVESPYMLVVAPVREEKRVPLGPEERARLQDPDLRVRVSVPRSTIPAVTHVDYSARVQTVDPERHGRYYRLMRRFHELTGCPVIVNTSFNIRGEPIVCTPDQALQCFLGTEMDVLVLGNHLLTKDRQPDDLLRGAEAYRALYGDD
jgi:carbamoyltransferase